MIKYKGHFWRATKATAADDYYGLAHAFTQCCGGSMPHHYIEHYQELKEGVNLYYKGTGPYAGLTLEEFLIKIGFGERA